LVEKDGSDLFLKVDSEPRLRIDGKIERADLPKLSREDLNLIASQILTGEQLQKFKAECPNVEDYKQEFGEEQSQKKKSG
jgi:Tfp pilus assembly pilus retraction ATPase PilT